MLERHGVSDFLFLLSYRSERIIAFLEARGAGNDRFRWSVEPSPLGTGGAVRHAAALLCDEFLLINGDSYLDMDYEGLAAAFRGASCTGMLAVYDNRRDTAVPNNVALDDSGRVSLYEKAGSDERLRYVDAGVLALRKSVLDLIPADTVCSMENEIYPRLIERGALDSFVAAQRFYDIGTPERLREFEAYLSTRIHKYGDV